MKLLNIFVFILAAFIVVQSATERPVSKQDACNFWWRFTEEMNNITNIYSYLSYNCSYNKDTCNGADCAGSINYQLQGMKLVNVSFCFGLRVNHCDNPISVDIYMVNKQNGSFTDRIYHEDKKELKSLKMDLANIGTAQPYLFFNLTKPVPHHVLFGIRLKVKVTSHFFDYESWPPQYQQDLIPNTEIPVTPCTNIKTNTTVPPITEPKCVYHAPGILATTTLNPTQIKSPTLNKPCDLSSFTKLCSANEVCSQETGTCVCADIHPFDPSTGMCSGKVPVTQFPFWVLDSTTFAPSVITHNSQPHTGEQSKDSSVNKPALIGGIVAGVVFLLIVVILAVFVCRRYRNNQNYVGRLLLNNDDDSDNVI